LHGLHHEVSVVAYRDIATLLKFEHRVIDHFLAVGNTGCFGPCELTGVLLAFEELVALGGAEAEELGVVTDEDSSVSGVNIAGAEIALLDSHLI